MIRRLWNDTDGGVSAGVFLLLIVLIGIGSVVGLQIIRDHIVQEYGDVAVALERLSQSYRYRITVNGNIIVDVNHTDPAPTITDPIGGPPACLQFIPPDPGSEEGDFDVTPMP